MIANDKVHYDQTREITELPPRDPTGPQFVKFIAAVMPYPGLVWSVRVLKLGQRQFA